MAKWVTCREPQGRAIGKIHIDKEVQDFYKNELPRHKRRGIKMSVLSFLSQPRKRDLCFAPTSCGELNPTDFASSFK